MTAERTRACVARLLLATGIWACLVDCGQTSFSGSAASGPPKKAANETDGGKAAAKAAPTPDPHASANANAKAPAPPGITADAVLKKPQSSQPPPPPPPAKIAAGDTSLSGDVRNALDKSPIANATLQVVGGPSVQSDASGHFVIPGLPTGVIKVQASATGFTSDSYSTAVIAGSPATLYIVMSPQLKSGEVRFVLTWGASPQDLDGHLRGPRPDGQRFHVYYANKAAPNVAQDRDDVAGFGPETITVKQTINGHYEYYVVDYTNACSGTPDGALATSSASVKVYQGSEVLGTFTIDPNGAGAGAQAWNVLSVDVSNGVVSLSPVNTTTPTVTQDNCGA